MTARKKKTAKPIKAWGGFCGGRLHERYDRDNYSYRAPFSGYAIYTTYSGARARYADVRRVLITEVD